MAKEKIKIIWILALLITLQITFAQDSCGITNFATCLPEKFFSYVSKLISAPLDGMLNFMKIMISIKANTDLFKDVWATMVYVISMFYGLMFMWSGFQFMISGYDVVQREKAKMFLKNTVVMIVLVQASYFLYLLILEIAEILTAGVINMIPQNFFSSQSFGALDGILLQLLAMTLVGLLLIAGLLFAIRFVVVSLGVALFPIGIFCYFFEPLNDYGRLIVNFIFSNIFITFFSGLILLAFARLSLSPDFANYKMYFLTSAFLCIIIADIFVCWFSVIKSATKSAGSVVSIVSKFKGF